MDRKMSYTTQYGDLKFDASCGWYEGSLTMDGCTVTVAIDLDPDNEQVPFDVLEDVAGRMSSFDRECREYAADGLLDDANDWLADSDAEGEYTREQFMELMELEYVVISPEGGIQVSYADGDMFWGHTIMVDVSPEGEFFGADIAG